MAVRAPRPKKLVSIPAAVDDEQFRALKISGLNHLATEAALRGLVLYLGNKQ